MWYAVETAFIKGRQYKSRILFNKNMEPNNQRYQSGTCLCGHNEEPHNMCKTFMDGEIEIHTDWFQTKEQAITFANGSTTYVIHKRVWYDVLDRSFRSNFIKWESVPANGDYLPFRGVYKHHYKEGKEVIQNQLLQELMNAKDKKEKEIVYGNLAFIGIDKAAADKLLKQRSSAV